MGVVYLWVWFIYGCGLGFSDWYSPVKLPTLIKWVNHMLTVDEIKNMAMSSDDHNKFLKTVQVSNYYQ